jgi:hypothetical protein
MCPDLLNATMRDGTYVGKVQLLVPAEVILVSLVVRQWRARDRTGVLWFVLSGACSKPSPHIWHLTVQAQQTVCACPMNNEMTLIPGIV